MKKTKADIEEVEGTCTEIMVNDSVETTGKAGEGHPGFHSERREAGHIVRRVEHVEHDMTDDMGERTMTNTTNANGEQTESVIETEHLDEELPAQCTRSDEEAGSIVATCRKRHERERKKTMKKQTKQQQQKRLRRYQRKTLKSEDSWRREETHPKKRNNE